MSCQVMMEGFDAGDCLLVWPYVFVTAGERLCSGLNLTKYLADFLCQIGRLSRLRSRKPHSPSWLLDNESIHSPGFTPLL